MDWLARRRYRGLVQLIHQLPAASRLNEAVQNDPEEARRIAQGVFDLGDEAQQTWSPPLREYDLVATLLRDVRNAISDMHESLVKSNGGKGKIPHFPGPETEVQRALRNIEQEWSSGVLGRYGFSPDQF